MELTTSQAAERLDVNQARVRALIASGMLSARRVGPLWLIDADSLDHQAALSAANATSRPMAPRTAWAAADLADGGNAPWLSPSDRSRLRKRLRARRTPETMQRWFAARACPPARYRASAHDLQAILRIDGITATGISAARAHGLDLAGDDVADLYVSDRLLPTLVEDAYLIESEAGNLTVRACPHDFHLDTSRAHGDLTVTPRLVTAVDLLDDRDTRTHAAGRRLAADLLDRLR